MHSKLVLIKHSYAEDKHVEVESKRQVFEVFYFLKKDSIEIQVFDIWKTEKLIVYLGYCVEAHISSLLKFFHFARVHL